MNEKRALLIVAVVCLVLYGLNWLAPLMLKPELASALGDSFGVVNALFSGAAFLGLIYAILLQKEELGLQRLELQQTREELAGQKEQLQLQNATFRQQSFDGTFFQMLSLHHQIVNSMDMRINIEETLKGRDCFVRMYDALHRTLGMDHIQKFAGAGWPREAMEMAYKGIYDLYQADLGHYFRNLYNIVKFVDRSSVEDKKFYTNLLRAQLSSHELLLLFYNCATAPGREKDGTEKFKPLVEKYALLKNMPEDKLINSVAHKAWYSNGAYGA